MKGAELGARTPLNIRLMSEQMSRRTDVPSGIALQSLP